MARRLATALVGLVLVVASVEVVPSAGAAACTDYSATFSGTVSGGPEEVAAGSLDTSTHSAEIGSESCRVASITASLTSTTASNLDLHIDWEGLEVAGQFGEQDPDLDSNETLTKTGLYGGSYDFRVVPLAAAGDDYSLSVTADVEPITPVSGTNSTKPFVVIAVVDTGINPYHDQFSAGTYPDSPVDLTIHPSSYLEEYPAGATPLNLSLNTTTYAAAVATDSSTWSSVQEGRLYWIPGTKIIGAYDGGGGIQSGRNILDDNGHGTHSAGVAVGNTMGSCKRCLLVAVEGTGGLNWAFQQPWIDFVSNSWGNRANAGVPTAGRVDGPVVDLIGDAGESKAAVARGQTVLFAAGNGYENGFVTPEPTYTSPFTGPDWIVTVGAAWRHDDPTRPYCNCPDDESVIVQSGKPVDVSSFGLGAIPSPIHDSISGSGDHSGTSAATPIVAGVMGEVLLHAREGLGDVVGGSREGVVASGTASGSGLISDGDLTRAELERVIKYTAEHTRSRRVGTPFYILLVPTGLLAPDRLWAAWALEGWGVVLPRTGATAKAIVDGTLAFPSRPMDEELAARDKQAREALWGPSL